MDIFCQASSYCPWSRSSRYLFAWLSRRSRGKASAPTETASNIIVIMFRTIFEHCLFMCPPDEVNIPYKVTGASQKKLTRLRRKR
jgi:hypothetical protein